MAFSFIPTKDPVERKKIFSWQMYDWANSAFITVMVTAIMPIYFANAVMKKFAEDESYATFVWNVLGTVSTIGVALAAFLLGPVADVSPRKKKYLGIFTALGVGATLAMAISPPEWWVFICASFIVGYVGFGASMIFYDAMLPGISRRDTIDNISSGGYAIGYVGGGVCLALCIALVQIAPKVNEAITSTIATRIGFVVVAIWWAMFSVPLFRHVPETGIVRDPRGANTPIKPRRLRDTFAHLRQYPQALTLLIAFWIYNDGVSTIIKTAVSYAKEVFAKIGIAPDTHLLVAVLVIQFVGMPCAYFWAFVAQKIGAKWSIMWCLVVYTAVCILGYFMSEVWHFYALGIMVAFGQGGVQALSRSLFASHIPPNRETEFFGFYNISGKFASVLGPMVFAIVNRIFHSSQNAILALVAFFVVGGLILLKVKDLPIEGPQPVDSTV